MKSKPTQPIPLQIQPADLTDLVLLEMLLSSQLSSIRTALTRLEGFQSELKDLRARIQNQHQNLS